MAVPIVRISHAFLSLEDQKRVAESIKKSIDAQGVMILDQCCELLGVIQDDGAFMPYLPDATYVIPESRAARMRG